MSYIDYLKASDRNTLKNEILERYESAAQRNTSTQDIMNEQSKLGFERHNKMMLEDATWLDRHISESATIQNETLKYNEAVKSALLKECIMYLYKHSKDKADWEYDDALAESFVDKYVNDTGATIILNRMKDRSLMLSEMSLYIEKACNKETCDDDDEDAERLDKLKKYMITSNDKDDFFDNLDNTADIEDVSQSVLMRVTSSMAEFINDSNAKKQRIEDTIGDIKAKVDANTSEDVKEALELNIKRHINNIENEGYTNLFGKLVQELSESAYKNDQMKTQFCTENKLNMEKVIQHVKTLYTVLEVLNTSKIDNLDEEYVESIVESYTM